MDLTYFCYLYSIKEIRGEEDDHTIKDWMAPFLVS
ncbi:hypothetical protein J2S17_002697 [Cytobacillus purgationiresistens]|uniref:Uncharacterized protein n=1 Tax=Cytobacillus purgationiresistens TaxID=863449 RepID=A0ABU0AHW4_9BACI|nr:hypothetical protein [Cytobacillus purgationiresistens]